MEPSLLSITGSTRNFLEALLNDILYWSMSENIFLSKRINRTSWLSGVIIGVLPMEKRPILICRVLGGIIIVAPDVASSKTGIGESGYSTLKRNTEGIFHETVFGDSWHLPICIRCRNTRASHSVIGTLRQVPGCE